MSLIYSDNKAPFTGSFDMAKANANKHWRTHFDNSLYLKFMLDNGNVTEKHMASKELPIAERKMAFWERHHNFDSAKAQRDAEAAKRAWAR